MLPTIAVMAALTGLNLNAEEPPTEAQIIRALPPVARIPHFYEESRDNIIVTKNLLKRSTISVPLFEGVTVVKEHWECTVYFERLIASDYPVPLRLQKPAVVVVYVDELKLAKPECEPKFRDIPAVIPQP
jgi:hypothetical protein